MTTPVTNLQFIRGHHTYFWLDKCRSPTFRVQNDSEKIVKVILAFFANFEGKNAHGNDDSRAKKTFLKT
jgi:hypothetical protein